MMASIAEALGPRRVCCLTGVPSDGNAVLHCRVYRRPSAFSRSQVVEAIGLGFSLLEIVARHRPQALQLATISEGYLGLFLKRRVGLPYVVYVHGNEIAELASADSGAWNKPVETLRDAKKVLAVSQFTADLARMAGVEEERIAIVHPGCDSDFFRPKAPDQRIRRQLIGSGRGPVIVTVGNLVERKGHDVVIKAMPRLLHAFRDLTYFIVGDGPYRQQLERLAVTVGVRDNVIFAGRLPQTMLPDIYAISDVFIMASRHRADANDVEGFGLVFLEAGACGKPVIGGRSGGIPDAIADGSSGFTVDPHDIVDIAERLEWLIANPNIAKQMGEYGRHRVVEQFQWATVAEKVLRALE